MDLAYPFRIDSSGRTAGAGRNDHIRQMIEQVLFTAPGERVNRPDFGTGLRQYIFAGGGDETLTAVQFLVQAALQKWLGDVIEVEAVEVTSEDSTMAVVVRYRVRRSQQRTSAEFTI
jgi:phage baseplate assembly protein W